MDMIDELTASVNEVKKWINLNTLSAAHPLNRLCKTIEDTVGILRKSDMGEGNSTIVFNTLLSIECEILWPNDPHDFRNKKGRVYFILDDKGVTTVP